MPADKLSRAAIPRPAPHDGAAGFAAALHDLRSWSGLTYKSLERRQPALKVSTTSDYCRGNRPPRDWEWVHTFVLTCLAVQDPQSCDISAELSHWRAAWAHTRRYPAPGTALGFAAPPGAPPAAPMPRPAAPSAPPMQLPHDVVNFTGRRYELGLLGKLAAVIDNPVIVAISAPASVGKTGLAIHWSHQQHPTYPDGILYAELNGSGPEPLDPSIVLEDFLYALGKPSTDIPASVQGRAAVFRTLTHTARMLIVLDDAASYDHIRHLIPSGPSCRVLITSRESIPELLVIDGALPVILPPLDTREAMALLTSIMNPAREIADVKSLRALATKAGGDLHALRIIGTVAAYHPKVPLFNVLSHINVERPHLPSPHIPLPVVRHTMQHRIWSGGPDDNEISEHPRELDGKQVQELAASSHPYDRMHAAIWIHVLQESKPELFFTLLLALMQDSDNDVHNVACASFEEVSDEYLQTMITEGEISHRDAERLMQIYSECTWTREENPAG